MNKTNRENELLRYIVVDSENEHEVEHWEKNNETYAIQSMQHAYQMRQNIRQAEDSAKQYQILRQECIQYGQLISKLITEEAELKVAIRIRQRQLNRQQQYFSPNKYLPVFQIEKCNKKEPFMSLNTTPIRNPLITLDGNSNKRITTWQAVKESSKVKKAQSNKKKR